MNKRLIPILLIVSAGSLAVAGVVAYWKREAPPVTAVRLDRELAFTLPEFVFTERDGRTRKSEELRGKIWVAGFIFTRCHHTCPMVTGVMARLRTELPDDVQMVSFTVDPEYDTPEILAAYAKDFDPANWWFLTGDRDRLYTLIREGFKLGVRDNPEFGKQPGELILHSTRLAVVDQQGQVRGYFDASDSAQVDQLQRRVKELLR